MPSRNLLIDPSIPNSGSYAGIAGNLSRQPANTVLAGPTSGDDDVPAFRLLTIADQSVPAAPQVLNDAATVAWTTGAQQLASATVTITDDRILAITDAVAGQIGILEVVQGGSGSYTLALPSGSIVSGGGSGVVTLTTSVGAVDRLVYFYDGTSYLWDAFLNYT